MANDRLGNGNIAVNPGYPVMLSFCESNPPLWHKKCRTGDSNALQRRFKSVLREKGVKWTAGAYDTAFEAIGKIAHISFIFIATECLHAASYT